MPVASADDLGGIVIAPEVPGESRLLGGIAAADNIVVAWQQGHLSFMRWSDDGGATFEPKVALRKGLRAKRPNVAACGDFIWAASTWKTSSGTLLGVDYRQVSAGDAGAGRFTIGRGHDADIACVGNIVALTWSDPDGHVQLAIVDGKCANPCAPAYRDDLGPGSPDLGNPVIAGYDHGFAVVFPNDGFLVNTFGVARVGGSIVVTPVPSVRVLAGKGVFTPRIGADGARVVIAYERFGQTLMIVSDDRGATFGGRIIVSNYCRDCPEGGSSPESVDVLGPNILVEVGAAGGLCPRFNCGWTDGFFTRTDGQKWKKVSHHGDGSTSGQLVPGGIAEAWGDSGRTGSPPEIRFYDSLCLSGRNNSTRSDHTEVIQMNILRIPRRQSAWTGLVLATFAAVVIVMPVAAATTGYLVRDLNGSIRSSGPERLTAVGSKLFFTATTYHGGRELYKSDGTAEGTVRVKDIYAGSNSSNPEGLVNVAGTLFFTAYDPSFGREVWKSDGTAVGTMRVADIRPGATSSNPDQLTAVGNRLFFTADTGMQGREVWVSDGTSIGTHLVKDVFPGLNDGVGIAPRGYACEHWETDPGLVGVGNRVYFKAVSSVGATPSLWVTDGTSVGTKHVKDSLGRLIRDPQAMTASNGLLLFRSGTNTDPSLWRSDGTKAGTRKISDADPFFLLDVAGTLFFRSQTWDAENSRWIRADIWKSNGTELGTALVQQVINPTYMAAADDRLYFAAGPWYPEEPATRLWSSDGSDVGTNPIVDVPFQFFDLVTVGNDAFYVLEDNRLYHSDGTTLGTQQVARPYATCSEADVAGTLFTSGYKPNASVAQNELWAVPTN